LAALNTGFIDRWRTLHFDDSCTMFDREEFRRSYALKPQYEQRVLIDPGAPPPGGLSFVDPSAKPDYAVNYPDWLRHRIGKIRLEAPLLPPPPAPDPPHVVSSDRRRVVVFTGFYRLGGQSITRYLRFCLAHEGGYEREIQVTLPYGGQVGPFLGSDYHSRSPWVCAFDCVSETPWRPESGVLRTTDYDAWLTEIRTRTSANVVDDLFLQRDLADAILQFSQVGALGHDRDDKRPPAEQTFDCVVVSAKFLGGRIVWPRVTIRYLSNFERGYRG
jgi:hypothetical protein